MITTKERFVAFTQSVTPGVITFFLIIIGAANLQISGFSSLVPIFSAMSVFYWGIYWPRMMPKWFVFVIGMFQDALYGMPALGMSSLLLLLLWGVVVSQRRHLIKEPFMVIWMMFSLSVVIYAILNWILYSLYLGEIIFSISAFVQLATSILFYPLVHKIFNAVHMAFTKTT